jgi:hypothetical protein
MPDPTSHMDEFYKKHEAKHKLAQYENYMLLEYQEGLLPNNWWLNPWSAVRQLQSALDKSVACYQRLFTKNENVYCDLAWVYQHTIAEGENINAVDHYDSAGRAKQIVRVLEDNKKKINCLENKILQQEAVTTTYSNERFFIKRELANKDYLNGSEINELNLRDAFDILICTDEVRKKKNEELLSQIAELEAECKRLREASFVTNVSSDDYKKLEDKYGLLKSSFTTDVIDENSVYVAPFDFCYYDEPIKKPSRKKPKAKAKRKSKPKTKNKRK